MGEAMKEGVYKISCDNKGIRYFSPYYPPYPLKASEYTPFYEWQVRKAKDNTFFIVMDNGLGAYIDRGDQVWVGTPHTPRVPFSIEAAGGDLWRVHLPGQNLAWTIDEKYEGIIILSPWLGEDKQKYKFEYVGPLPPQNPHGPHHDD